MKNIVIGKRSAIVDGRETGLAGCKTLNTDCLRTDSQLIKVLRDFKCGSCGHFIPKKGEKS